jgi:hypothetical protein
MVITVFPDAQFPLLQKPSLVQAAASFVLAGKFFNVCVSRG